MEIMTRHLLANLLRRRMKSAFMIFRLLYRDGRARHWDEILWKLGLYFIINDGTDLDSGDGTYQMQRRGAILRFFQHLLVAGLRRPRPGHETLVFSCFNYYIQFLLEFCPG